MVRHDVFACSVCAQSQQQGGRIHWRRSIHVVYATPKPYARARQGDPRILHPCDWLQPQQRTKKAQSNGFRFGTHLGAVYRRDSRYPRGSTSQSRVCSEVFSDAGLRLASEWTLARMEVRGQPSRRRVSPLCRVHYRARKQVVLGNDFRLANDVGTSPRPTPSTSRTEPSRSLRLPANRSVPRNGTANASFPKNQHAFQDHKRSNHTREPSKAPGADELFDDWGLDVEACEHPP